MMKSFIQWAEAKSQLYQQLMSLRGLMAQAAQEVYNDWDQESGYDDHGCGGICDDVARAISGVLSQQGIDTTDGGQDGDDHAWVIAYDENESYGVDIAPNVYETGGGYCWKKIPNVVFKPTDIDIWNLGIHPSEFENDYY